MNDSKTILLDCDGVLADFVGAVLKLVNRPDVQVDRWNFHEQFDMTETQLWKTINKAGIEFWSNLPKHSWAEDLIDMVYSNGAATRTILCTSPSLDPNCTVGKIEWITRNFPEFARRFMVTPCKHLLRGDFVLIDDSDENCERFWESRQEAILFPQLWNANKDRCHERIEYVSDQLRFIFENWTKWK